MSSAPDIYEDAIYRKGGKSKRTNVLLVRNPIGKVKPTTYDLPPENYTYGRRDTYDDEGAREVVGSWKQHTANPEQMPGRDFVRLNRSAVVQGCTTSKNISNFRLENDIRLATGPAPRPGDGAGYPNATTTFGRPSKPSTPISNLLCNSYQRNWIEQQRKIEAEQPAETRPAKIVSVHTRASLGHVKVRVDPPKAPFKMKQFQNVPSRVKAPKGASQRIHAPTLLDPIGTQSQPLPSQSQTAPLSDQQTQQSQPQQSQPYPQPYPQAYPQPYPQYPPQMMPQGAPMPYYPYGQTGGGYPSQFPVAYPIQYVPQPTAGVPSAQPTVS